MNINVTFCMSRQREFSIVLRIPLSEINYISRTGNACAVLRVKLWNSICHWQFNDSFKKSIQRDRFVAYTSVAQFSPFCTETTTHANTISGETA